MGEDVGGQPDQRRDIERGQRVAIIELRAQRLHCYNGNYDDFIPATWKPGFVGMALRVFSPEAQRWSIYWLDNTTGGVDAATGLLHPPVVGGFRDGVGIFEGQENFEGRPVRVRFEWSQMHTGAPRWQQAFSADGGATWEVNWVMEMARPV